MKVFFDETGRLLYNSLGLPMSITARQSQIELLYVIKREVFNQIVAWKISHEHSSGKMRNGMIDNYIRSIRPSEDISGLFTKDSRLISFHGREQVDEVIRLIERLYSNYNTDPSKVKIPKEVVFYMLFSPEEAKLEYSRGNRWEDTATSHSHNMDLVLSTWIKPKTLNGKIIVGSIHSHPEEMIYWKKVGNNAIF